MKKPKRYVAFMLAALMVGNSTFAHIPEIRADMVSEDGDDNTSQEEGSDNIGREDDSGSVDDISDASDDTNTNDTSDSGDPADAGTGDTDNAGDTGDIEDTGNAGDTGNTEDIDNADDTGNTEDTDTNSDNTIPDSDDHSDSEDQNEGDKKEDDLNSSEGEEQPITIDTQDEIPDTLTAASHKSVSSGEGAVGGTAAGIDIIEHKPEKAADPLEAVLETDLFYAVADETEITYHVTAEGGKAPYYYIFRAVIDDKVVYELEDDFPGSDDETEITYIPDNYGLLEAEIIVMDADDDEASAVSRIAVSAPENETEQDWERSTKIRKLTGDWRKDLLRIANTQVGYSESKKDFVVDEEHIQHRYNRYGAWYEEASGESGDDIDYRYQDWDTMFVSFCMNYAQIPEESFARVADFDEWEDQLAEADAYKDAASGYIPEPGDLILFAADEERPEHVAIVEAVSEDEQQIDTIEGDALDENAERSVTLIDDITEADAADTEDGSTVEESVTGKIAEGAKDLGEKLVTKVKEALQSITKLTAGDDTGVSDEDEETEATEESQKDKETGETIADDNFADLVINDEFEDGGIIEADDWDTVARGSYPSDDSRIAGYVSMRAMMEAAGVEVIDGTLLQTEDKTVRVIGDFSEEAQMEITSLDSGNYSEHLTQSSVDYMDSLEVNGGKIYCAYDITIREENGEKWEPETDHPATLQIQLSELAVTDISKLKVIHIKDDGVIETVPFEIGEDNRLSITADGFSAYIVAENKIDESYLASEDYIYFDLAAGDVKITSSSYEGAVYKKGTDDRIPITGTHNESNHYYVYQSNRASEDIKNNTGWSDGKVTIPVYQEVTWEGKPWSEYITGNPDVSAVIDNWGKAAEKVGRTQVDTYKIDISATATVVLDDLWSAYTGYSDDGPVCVSPSQKDEVTLQLKGSNRFKNIAYYCPRPDSGKLIFTNWPGYSDGSDSEGSATVAPFCTELKTGDTWNLWGKDMAVIGMVNTAEYGLTFSGGVVFAGFPAQNNHVWDDSTGTINRATCVGGGTRQSGEVTVNGGTLTAVSNGTAAAIGAGGGLGKYAGYGTVDISDGRVYAYATGVYYNQNGDVGFIPANAIGGASTFDLDAEDPYYTGETEVNISGGEVYAKSLGGIAIGGGSSKKGAGNSATINISGNANVTAYSQSGEVNTTSDGSGKLVVPAGTAIGGGVGSSGGSATVTVSGNPKITATSIGGGTAVGTTRDSKGGDADITVSGGTTTLVIGIGGGDSETSDGGAADMTVTGGTVIAGKYIGGGAGGTSGNGGNVTMNISGGTLKTGTIGGGSTVNPDGNIGSGTVTITDGDISGQFLLMGGSSDQCTFNMTGGLIHDVNTSDPNYLNRFPNGGAIYMDDDKGEVEITGGTIQNCTAQNGGAVYMDGGTLTAYGGAIDSCNAVSSTDPASVDDTGYGGAIYIGGGTFVIANKAKLSGEPAAISEIEDITKEGTISNCSSSKDGGAIYIANGIATLNDGSIVHNTAGINGGGIAVVGSSENGVSVSADGITLSENAATAGNGGGLYIQYGSFTMNGGAITGNIAAEVDAMREPILPSDGGDPTDDENKGKALPIAEYGNGGGVFVSQGQFMISADQSNEDDVVISDNVAAADGGGIYVRNGDVEVVGSTIRNNTAGRNGGGIANDNDEGNNISQFIVNGIHVMDNTAIYGNGGGIYSHYGNFEFLTAGVVSGNKALNWKYLKLLSRGNGGGIYIRKGKFSMKGGTVSDNKASRFGGGIYVYGENADTSEEDAIVLAGGTIENNKAGQSGGGFTSFKTSVTMNKDQGSGVQILNNEAVDGGGLYLRNGASLTMHGGVIKNNHAVSLDSDDLDSFYDEIKEKSISDTSLVAFGGTGKTNRGGNGGGVLIHNSTFTISSAATGTDQTGIAICGNTADRNGGGVYAVHESIPDVTENGAMNSNPLTVTIGGGNISDNEAGNNGGGIAMFRYCQDGNDQEGHSSAKITGSGLIQNNSASNGGGLFVEGGTLKVYGGVICQNKAAAADEEVEGLNTAYVSVDNKGVGGGVYVCDKGKLDLSPGTAMQQNSNNKLQVGVYDNEAKFAADDIYSSVDSTSSIHLPKVADMDLTNYNDKVIGKVNNWYQDYANGDNYYNESDKVVGAIINNGVAIRYKEATDNDQKSAVEDGTYSENYICLTLGFRYSRIALTVQNKVRLFGGQVDTSDIDNVVCHYVAVIKGTIDSEEAKAYPDQTERIFAPNPEAGTYTIIDSGKDYGASEPDGMAVITFDIESGNSITLQGVPIEAEVTIREVPSLDGYDTVGSISDLLSAEAAEIPEYETINKWTYKTGVLQTNKSTQSLLSGDSTLSITGVGNIPSTVTFFNAKKLQLEEILTAYEENYTPSEGKTKKFTIDFGKNGASDKRVELTGQKLYVRSITINDADGDTDGFTLSDKDSVLSKQRTAGYAFANSTFALGAKMEKDHSENEVSIGKQSEKNQPVEIGTVEQDDELTITLYNANALTKDSTAGTVNIELSTSSDPEAGIDTADFICVTLTIDRIPAQIHATVPLYVCMYGYGGDGTVVSPSEKAYCIVNNSGCPIQITQVEGLNSSWTLKSSSADLEQGELFLSLLDQAITSAANDTAKNSKWRITGGSKLGISIQAAIAGNKVNDDSEWQACSVKYTAKIPKE